MGCRGVNTASRSSCPRSPRDEPVAPFRAVRGWASAIATSSPRIRERRPVRVGVRSRLGRLPSISRTIRHRGAMPPGLSRLCARIQRERPPRLDQVEIQPAAPAQPGERPLHAPPGRDRLERRGTGLLRPDLQAGRVAPPQLANPLGGPAVVDRVGRDDPRPQGAVPQRPQDELRPVLALDIGGVDQDRGDQAEGVHEDVRFRPFTPLPAP